jgi:hypothetical protein
MTVNPHGVIRAVRNPGNVGVSAVEFAIVLASTSAAVVY